MPYHQPLVSICIPVCNAERTVISALHSILNQTYRNMEILIVDNASTDNTLNLLQKLNDPRIKIHRNENNIGQWKNFDRCVELASGEYTAIFHADDLYMPDIVEKQVRTFQDNPAIGAVFTMANLINEKGEVYAAARLPVGLRGKRVYYFPEIFISMLENADFLMCPSCMVRGKLYEELVPFDEERSGVAGDLDMWFRILEKYPIAILDEKLMSYRVSNLRVTFHYNYLRTESADFFRVMDHYMGIKSCVLNIPRDSLNKYEFLRSTDNLRRAQNYLIKRQPQDAKKLLKESFSAGLLWSLLRNIRRPLYLADWVLGMFLLLLIYLGLGQFIGRKLSRLLHAWNGRFI